MSLVPPHPLDGGLAWAADLRRAALARFEQDGLPTRRTEHWKYTNVRSLAKQQFVTGAGAVDFGGDLPEGAFLVPLADLDQRQRSVVAPHLGRIAQTENHPFAALNTALLHEGLALFVPKGKADVRVQWTTRGEAPARHPRLVIVLGRGAEVDLLERFDGEGEGVALTNAVTEIRLGDGAILRHTKVQRERPGAWHVGRIEAEVGRDAGYHLGLLNIGGATARTEITVRLDGPGSETQLNGLFAGRGSQLLDQHVHVEHQSPRATSGQLFRGILADAARGVFTGRVFVAEGAHHSSAEQRNPNLLLSTTAQVDTRPQLEIYNDDVQCSHGATVGRLDEDALFYLQARGIDVEQARQLLTVAFAADVISTLPPAVQTEANDWLHAWLGAS